MKPIGMDQIMARGTLILGLRTSSAMLATVAIGMNETQQWQC